MEKLNHIYSSERITGKDSGDEYRNAFQRDYDRIIFSSAFRRLQSKTQVFPLPGSVFVHNRLTHSLEVASVGRSLGSMVGKDIFDKFSDKLDDNSKEFYRYDLHDVIASACLCHDIGNPAFGHSGEDAIAQFFRDNEKCLKCYYKDEQWEDFINFEGNANGIRVLCHQQKGKSEGGLQLTYSTLAAIAKYPCESKEIGNDNLYQKFGFFQSEKSIFQRIAKKTGMKPVSSSGLIYHRHPFAWLVEAADDICYNIIDYEDAHRLRIIDHETCKNQLLFLIKCLDVANYISVGNTLRKIIDKNEKIGYLRAVSINSLVYRTVEVYTNNFDEIISGTRTKSLFEEIKETCEGLEGIYKYSIEHIYNNKSVVEIENAGYNVLSELLTHFLFPILKEKNNRTKADEKAIKLIPDSFNYDEEGAYIKTLGVLDFISGMTDNYATDLYRKIKGIDIGMTL